MSFYGTDAVLNVRVENSENLPMVFIKAVLVH